MPTISACLMVRDEEKNLPRCLASISGIVDEIILVDTGSTDGTLKIAENFGCQIYHHPWSDDFSGMRNKTLEYATGGWCLIIDADEQLNTFDDNILRKAVQHPENSGYHFMVTNVMDGGQNATAPSIRLFQNRKGFHYEGIVHNQLIITGVLPMTKIRMYHYGYNLSPEDAQKKYLQRSALMRKQIAANPNEPFPHYNLARMHLLGKYYAEAKAESLETIRILKERGAVLRDSVMATIYHSLFLACFYLKDYSTPVAPLMELRNEFPEYLDIHFDLATLYAMLDYPELAKESCALFLRWRAFYRSESWHFQTEVMTAENEGQLHYYLGCMYVRLGDVRTARSRLELAAQMEPEIPEIEAALKGIPKGGD